MGFRRCIAGLPGAEASYNRSEFQNLLAEYEGVPAETCAPISLRFAGSRTGCGGTRRLSSDPPDSPWPLFSLPRVASTTEDVRSRLAGVDTLANGLTFCVGPYGAPAYNHLLAMANEFASRIHFVHLRQVMREPDGSFYEAERLHGSLGHGWCDLCIIERRNASGSRTVWTTRSRCAPTTDTFWPTISPFGKPGLLAGGQV
jgi:mannonate dehydratase